MDYRIIAAFFVSQPVSIILYKIFIPILRKVKLGQKILEIGPAWHKCKEGTPVLGGLFFSIAMLVSVLIFLLPSAIEKGEYGLLAVAGLALANGMIGFIDDYVKLFKKRNKGLTVTQKLILQFLVAAAFLWVRSKYCGGSSRLLLPGGSTVELGTLYYFIAIVVIVYITNCSNLTDGIDGLLGSISVVIGVFFLMLSLHVADSDAAVLTAAILGALVGFLIFNYHPAKIFMGDTGSLFLGGLMTGLLFYFKAEILVFLVCFIWLAEGLSVMLQVAYYKLTKKRIFKMAPIHHHFEMSGWSEFKIVSVFSFVSVLMCVITFLIYYYKY
jgi:phospho-N-acetylmuramoyl-pentapeptide-transferase